MSTQGASAGTVSNDQVLEKIQHAVHRHVEHECTDMTDRLGNRGDPVVSRALTRSNLGWALRPNRRKRAPEEAVNHRRDR